MFGRMIITKVANSAIGIICAVIFGESLLFCVFSSVFVDIDLAINRASNTVLAR